MLFAGDRNIIGFLQSYPPKPIYGDAGIFAKGEGGSPGQPYIPPTGPKPNEPYVPSPGRLATNGIAPYTDPLSGVLVDGGTDIQHLLRGLGLPDNDIAMGNPSFDIGSGHKGANKAAKIYNKIRANDNMNEVETIKRILGGPSLPTF